MTIPLNVILIWLGSHASIPVGWIRETALDDKHPKAWGTQNPNVTGGSVTHTHISTAHSHTMDSHQHTFTLAQDPNPENHFHNDTGPGVKVHTHSGTTSTTTGGNLQSHTTDWSNAGNAPLNYKAIFIKPNSSPQNLVAGISMFFNGNTLPYGYVYCDGNNGTPDLRGRYLRGGTTNEDAGVGGGTNNHNHSVTHTHTADNHSHTGTSSANSGSGWVRGGGGDWKCSTNGHTHSVTLNNTAVVVDNYTNETAGSSDIVEPEYKKLGIIQNQTGSLSKGIIGLWLGSTDSIPEGWKLCDGNNDTIDLKNKFIKCADSLSQIGNTGGSNTHSHTAISHTHTSPAHTHSGSSARSSSGASQAWTDGGGYSHYQHTHAVTGVQSVQATYSSATIDCNTSDNQPEYKTVAYIQLVQTSSPGGAFLLNMI